MHTTDAPVAPAQPPKKTRTVRKDPNLVDVKFALPKEQHEKLVAAATAVDRTPSDFARVLTKKAAEDHHASNPPNASTGGGKKP